MKVANKEKANHASIVSTWLAHDHQQLKLGVVELVNVGKVLTIISGG